MSNCHHIFTSNDLDGAVSALVYIWSHSSEDSFQFTPISPSDISRLKSDIKNTHNPSKVLILGLPIKSNFFPELDESHITIIDNHSISQKYANDFKKSKVICKEYTSNSMLMYKMLKEKINATNNQKMLIALVDDFVSNKMEISNSTDLNLLFSIHYKNIFHDFIKDYMNGFKPFDTRQQHVIEIAKKQILNEISNIKVFSGEIKIEGIVKKTCAIMVENMNVNVIKTLIKKHSPEILFCINIKDEKVMIRQFSSENNINCGAFAEKYCNGSGDLNSAIGVITPLFMEITKNLNAI